MPCMCIVTDICIDVSDRAPSRDADTRETNVSYIDCRAICCRVAYSCPKRAATVYNLMISHYLVKQSHTSIVIFTVVKDA